MVGCVPATKSLYVRIMKCSSLIASRYAVILSSCIDFGKNSTFRQEIMKVKGFQVSPAELESCVLAHPDVSDTCVVPISDSYSGELPMAFVVLHPNAVKRIALDPAEIGRVKTSITKV